MAEDKHQQNYYPVFLSVSGKKCIVVGGGEVALRKVKALLHCEGNVLVISPELCPGLNELVMTGKIRAIMKNYESGDLKDAFLAVAATDRDETNEQVSEEARRSKVLINVVDHPRLSDFIVPAHFYRGDLTIAISTAGKSPALARKIRTELEKNYGEEYPSLVGLMEEIRAEMKRKRRKVTGDNWQKAINLDSLCEMLRSGQREKARAQLLENLEQLYQTQPKGT